MHRGTPPFGGHCSVLETALGRLRTRGDRPASRSSSVLTALVLHPCLSSLCPCLNICIVYEQPHSEASPRKLADKRGKSVEDPKQPRQKCLARDLRVGPL